VLAIGLVVDDAIVVLENIFRHIEEGLTPFQAAIKGVREISFAVVAMTLTLVAVFAPLAFTPGRTGRLFGEFALTLAGAVVVSGFVALTLTPMLCSKLLRHNPAPNRFDRGMERVLVGLTNGLRRRGAALGRCAALVGAAGDAGVGCGQLVAVQHGQERTVAAGGPRRDLHAVRAPDGATLDYTARYLDAIEAIGVGVPRVRPPLPSSSGRWQQVSRARSCCARSTGTERKTSRIETRARAAAPRWSAPAGRHRPSRSRRPAWGRAFASGRSTSWWSAATATTTWRGCAADDGRDGQEPRHRAARHRPAAEQARDLHGRGPHRAADMGVSVDAVARTVETMLGGRAVTRYKRDADQYDVIVQTSAAAAPRPRTSRSSSCAAATTPWCRCRRWSRCARR
jgi:multidrug efflux pump